MSLACFMGLWFVYAHPACGPCYHIDTWVPVATLPRATLAALDAHRLYNPIFLLVDVFFCLGVD